MNRSMMETTTFSILTFALTVSDIDSTSSFLDAEVWRCCMSDVARFLNEQVLQLDLIVFRNMMTGE